MEIRKFKNWEQVYTVIGHGAFYYQGFIYAGEDWQLHFTSKNPALYYKNKVVAVALKDINSNMRFYGIHFVQD